MAGTIKGITVEIGGDTTKLTAALADVNSTTKGLQSELREVDKLLKLDDSNITLCTQKEELLTEAVAATEEKLAILKEAEAQVQEQFENGEVSEEQYRALERQIAQTEIQLGTYKSQLSEVQAKTQDANGDTKDLGDAFENAGNKAKEAGEKGEDGIQAIAEAMTEAGLVAALTEAAEAMVKLAGNSSNASEILAQGTGATGDALNSLYESLEKVYAGCDDASVSMTDCAAVVAEMNTRTGATGEILENLSSLIVTFAEQTGTDAAGAVDSVVDVMKKWGIETEDMGSLLDTLTVANQSCSLSVDEITGYLTSNKAQFDALGYSVEDSTALLVSLADSGANTSTIMNGLRSAVSTLSESTDDVPAAFQSMIAAIGDCDDATSALQLVVDDAGNTVEDVFGTRAAQEMINAIQSGNFALEEWQDVLSDCNGALESTANASDSMEDKWGSATKSLETMFSTTFAPAIQTVVGIVADLVAAVADLVTRCPVLQAVVAALAAAFGVLAVALAISNTISLVQKAMALLNTTMLANPILLVVAAIAALVVAFIYLWNNCDAFREFWINLWEKIQNAAETAWNALSSFFTTIWTTISNFFTNTWNAILTVATTIFTTIQSAITNPIETAKELVVTAFTNLKETVTNIINNIKTTITNVFGGIKDAMGDAISNAKENVITKCKEILSGMKDIFKNIKETFADIGKNVIQGIINGITSSVSSLYESIKSALSGLVDKAKSALGIASPSRVFASEIGQFIPPGIAQGVASTASVASQAISDMIDDTLNDAQLAVSGSIGVGSAMSLATGTTTSAGVANVSNSVTINTESVDTTNIEYLCDVINRRLGMAY